MYTIIGRSEVPGVMNMLGAVNTACRWVHHIVVPMQTT